jgi:ureidoacrylate peracid hydrolase
MANNRAFRRSLAECVTPGKSKRSDFPLVPSRCALLIIDIQTYLSIPSDEEQKHSYFFSDALPRTVRNIEELIKTFRSLRDSEYEQGCEVIFTYLEALTKDCRDVSLDYKLSGPKLASLPNSGTAPAEFLPQVSPSSLEGRGDIKIPKTSCSVFPSTNLQYVLRNLHTEQLVITGQLTDQCVESAVRDAADLGFFVTVVDDACAAMSLDSHEKGLHSMKGFCRIVSTKDVMEELSKGYSVEDLDNIRL